jgi:hypothetical protein
MVDYVKARSVIGRTSSVFELEILPEAAILPNVMEAPAEDVVEAPS